VPIQLLHHCSGEHIPEEWLEKKRKAGPPHKAIVGVVVSQGKMDKVVKVRLPGQRWEKKIKKVRITAVIDTSWW
jgi:hypothetical protein